MIVLCFDFVTYFPVFKIASMNKTNKTYDPKS